MNLRTQTFSPHHHLSVHFSHTTTSVHMKGKVLVTPLCPTLCDPMDCSPPGSSVHGVLQARILEWVAIPFSRGFPNTGIEPGSHELRDSLPSGPPGKQTSFLTLSTVEEKKVKVAQLPPALFDLVDCSPPGSSVHGVLQARILGWVAIPLSRGSS